MKITYRHLLLSTVFLRLLVGGPSAALAQTIDYGSLQSLFGEPVTTSATGKPQRVSEAPVDMEIITADDIRKSGAHDIAEALRGVPGLNVMQFGRQDYEVGMRGYDEPYSPNILVLVNGRQVYLDDYGYVNWAAIPVQLSEIRQIEVVKGPNTALFGFNAADGVINIVTMNPLYDKTADASTTVGTGDYRDASVVDSVNINNIVGIRISAGASKAHEFKDEVNSEEPDALITDPEKQAVNIDSIIQVTPKSQIRLEASNSETKQTEMTSAYFFTKGDYETNSLKATYTADTDYGLVEATVYKNFLDTSFGGDLFDVNSPQDVKNNVVVSQIGDTFKVGTSNTFRVEGEYRHNEASGSLFGPSGASVEDDDYGLSGMWTWAINKSWSLTNSARIDSLRLSHSGPIDPSAPFTDSSFDRTITKPSYNSGLVWKATDDDAFRLNTGRGLRMGSFFDFAASVPSGVKSGPFPVVDFGVPNVNPTAVTDYELGWDHKIKPINGSFKADVFTEKTTNETSSTASVVGFPPPEIVAQSDGNIGWSQSMGLETTLQGKLDQNWSWSINDTVVSIHDHYSDDTDTHDRTPHNLTNLHLGYQNGPWETDGYVYYTTTFKEPEPTVNPADIPIVTVPSHISLSARAAYTFSQGLTAAISGQELQDSQSETNTGLETERRLFLTLDQRF